MTSNKCSQFKKQTAGHLNWNALLIQGGTLQSDSVLAPGRYVCTKLIAVTTVAYFWLFFYEESCLSHWETFQRTHTNQDSASSLCFLGEGRRAGQETCLFSVHKMRSLIDIKSVQNNVHHHFYYFLWYSFDSWHKKETSATCGQNTVDWFQLELCYQVSCSVREWQTNKLN